MIISDQDQDKIATWETTSVTPTSTSRWVHSFHANDRLLYNKQKTSLWQNKKMTQIGTML